MRSLGAAPVLAVILCLLLVACAAKAPIVSHKHSIGPARQAQLLALSSIKVLPPEVTVIQHHLADDPEKLHQHERVIAKVLLQNVASIATQPNVTVKEYIAADSQQTFQAYRISATVERLLGNVYQLQTPLLITHSLGPVVNRLQIDSKNSAVLVMHYKGYLKSTGQRRKERIASSLYWLLSLGRYGPAAPPRSNGDLLMVLLSANTGDVLWQGRGSAEPARLPELVALLLKTLPVGSEPAGQSGEPELQALTGPIKNFSPK